MAAVNAPGQKITFKTFAMKPAAKLFKMVMILFFTVFASTAIAQTNPYPNQGNHVVCVNSTQPYGVVFNGGSSYAWTITPATAGTITNGASGNLISVNWTQVGNATLQVTETNSSNCSETVSIQITVNPLPTATVAAGPAVCSGSTATFTISGTAGDVVTYNIGGGASQQATIGAGGTVAVTVANATADQVINLVSVTRPTTTCTQALTATATVTVNPLPTATAVTTPVCVGETITLTGGPAGMANYAWTSTTGFTSNVQSPTIPNATTANSGQYTLTVTNSNGCTDSETITVTVNPKPTTSPITHN